MPLQRPVSTSITPKTRSSRTKRKRFALVKSTPTIPAENCTLSRQEQVLSFAISQPQSMKDSKKEAAVEAEEENLVVVIEVAAEVVAVETDQTEELPVSSSSAKVPEERAVALSTTRMSSPAFERALGLCCP